MSALPLKAKVTIRDLWDKPDAPAPAAMKKLKEIIGIDVICNPQWQILISDLEKSYEDKAQLIGYVVGSLQVWFETMAELLDDTSLDQWAETLLNRIYEVSRNLNIAIEVSEGETASTHFSPPHRGFIITLPSHAVNPPAQFAYTFKDQILDSAEEKPLATPSIPIGGGGWSYVDSNNDAVTEASIRPAGASNIIIPDVTYLPDPAALPKPATLLLKPPYHMIVTATGNNHIEVQCSHVPTLDVISGYLKRWCRVNTNQTDKPPVMEIQSNLSTCSFGQAYDTLTIAAPGRSGNYFTVSPTLVLTLVEGSLGYKLVYSDASHWHYRKDTPFHTA